MGRLQTEMGSPSSLSEVAFGDSVTKPKGRLARPSRGVKTSLESAESMIDGGAKDTLIHEISNKYQYESKLEGNEGAPISRYQNINSEHFAYIMFEPTRYEKDLQPYINAYGPTLRIPVSPATLAISKESEHNEVQSIMFGGILERNAPGLRHFAVTSFIPGTPYTTGYGDYGFQNYYPWAEDRGDGQRVYTNGTLEDGNLICTQTGWISFVNLLMDRRIILKFHLIKAPAFRHRDECFHVCIKSFTYQHNPHDDLDYTIEFVEWREPSIRVGEEQVIDLKEDTPPAHKKSPAGGQILLVMHEFQGVNTMLIHESAQILLQLHGGWSVRVDNKSAPVFHNIPDMEAAAATRVYKSAFIDALASKKLSDVDLRPTKLTSVSLGLKPTNMSGLNELGYKAYSLSQLKKSEYEELRKRLPTRSGTLTVSIPPIMFPHQISYDEFFKNCYARLVPAVIKGAESYVFESVRTIVKNVKFLSPKPLKLYDGGDFTGYGENGETPTYDGTIQAHGRNLTDITASAITASTSDAHGFTANPVYDPDSKTMNINRSGIHDLIIDETGQVRYDDLVRRVKKFNIPLKDCKIGASISIIECRITGYIEDYQLWNTFACAFTVSIWTCDSQISNDLYSTVDTVGTKLYKGQRITVLDSHLRTPTKTELALQKRQREWDGTRSDRPRS